MGIKLAEMNPAEKQKKIEQYQQVVDQYKEIAKELGQKNEKDWATHRVDLHFDLKSLPKEHQEKVVKKCPRCNHLYDKDTSLTVDNRELCYACAYHVAEKQLKELEAN